MDDIVNTIGDNLQVVFNNLSFLDVTPIKNLMSPLADQAAIVSESAGLPIDQVNFLLLFFLSYPLALIHRQIWNPTIRHLFSAVFGILTVIYMVGNDFYHSLFTALVTYIILVVVRNPFGTKLIWFWAFGWYLYFYFFLNISHFNYFFFFLLL